MWEKVKWFLHQTGVSTGRIFDPAFDGYRPEVQRAQHLPDGQIRIHLFAANFDSIHAANQFCFGDGGRNSPEPITKELDGATIDITHIEVVCDTIADWLERSLSDADANEMMQGIAGRNTMIVIKEEAFGDLPFVLQDTKKLTYLGAKIISV